MVREGLEKASFKISHSDFSGSAGTSKGNEAVLADTRGEIRSGFRHATPACSSGHQGILFSAGSQGPMKPKSSRVATGWGRRIGVQWLHLESGRLDDVFAANRAEQDSTRLDIQDRAGDGIDHFRSDEDGGRLGCKVTAQPFLAGRVPATAVAVEKQEDELTLTTTVVFSFD
jgi:hypothetical protein